MKKLILLSFILLVFFGCAKNSENSRKIKIITTLFPFYDFAKEVGQDKVDVSLLLPPGAEAHSFEPSPRDIIKINESSIFIYTGSDMEFWASDILKSIKNNKLKIIDASRGIELLERDPDKEEKHLNEKNEHNGEHNHGKKDPHIWLDFSIDQKIVNDVFMALSEIDPANKNFYEKNTKIYIQKLDSLDKKYKDVIARCSKKVIMSGGHFVFGYPAKRYGLKYISPYTNFSADSEPSPRNITELIDNIKHFDIKVLYYEELLEPKVAKTISREAKVELLLLHGAHNLSKEELDKKITFLDIMNDNLEKLKIGLEYK